MTRDELAARLFVVMIQERDAAHREWCTERRVELVKIECTASDLQPNGDYEGDLLRSGRGKIVARKPFADTKKISAWVDGREEW